jgi:benzodiazapine receptor
MLTTESQPLPPRWMTAPRGLTSPFSIRGYMRTFEHADDETYYSPDEPSRAADVIVLLSLIVICNGLGYIVGLTADQAYYEALVKPTWAPTWLVLAPIWTVLYTAMGLGAWMVWRSPDTVTRNTALGWFAGQLVLNLAWTPIFFGAHAQGMALFISVALFSMIAATMSAFFYVRKLAALLLLPYLLAVGYGASLNAAIWALNR